MVLDPKNRQKVKFYRVFDTYKCSKSLDNFIYENIEIGSVIIAASKDDFTTTLS